MSKMASLLEELKLLSLPEPAKVGLEDFDGDLTSAKIINRDELADDDIVNSSELSNLRRKTALSLSVEDKKYVGKTISRRELSKLRGDLSEEEDLGEEDLSGSGTESAENLVTQNDDNLGAEIEDNSGAESDLGGESTDNDKSVESFDDANTSLTDGYVYNEVNDVSKETMKNNEDIEKFSSTGTNEVEKGKAVLHQIGLWDSFLENRIQIQKTLVHMNKLPQCDMFQTFLKAGGSQVKEPLKKTQENLLHLLHNLLVLQQTLLKQNEETKTIFEPRNTDTASDEDIPSDLEGDEDETKKVSESNETARQPEYEKNDKNKTDNETKIIGSGSLILSTKRKNTKLDDYDEVVSKRHEAFAKFRDNTIKKWNEKTRLASGKVDNKSFSSFDRSTLNQIKQILSDRERLVKRTQLKRSSYRVLGTEEDPEVNDETAVRDVHLKDYDTEIFDDDDFYHQLLREFIERKSNVDPNDPVAMGRQWLEIQRLRSKVKRKIDTKASKGRRLRYDAHTKLVSFMAPQTKGSMPDSSRNELFSSLFGKRQEQVEISDISLFR